MRRFYSSRAAFEAGAAGENAKGLINQGETPYDDTVSLRLWTGIGEVLPAAVERAAQPRG
jgi:hypothetical protein